MTTNTDALSALQRGEISATETYNQAMEKFAGQPEQAQLQRLRDEHRETANMLRQHVREVGGEPSQDSGWWGSWAKFVEGAAKIFGKTAALKALKEGEEHGLTEYQAVFKADVPQECKSMIHDKMLPQINSHIRELDRLMNAQSAS